MNTAEIKLDLFRKIDGLENEYLLQIQELIEAKLAFFEAEKDKKEAAAYQEMADDEEREQEAASWLEETNYSTKVEAEL